MSCGYTHDKDESQQRCAKWRSQTQKAAYRRSLFLEPSGKGINKYSDRKQISASEGTSQLSGEMKRFYIMSVVVI